MITKYCTEINFSLSCSLQIKIKDKLLELLTTYVICYEYFKS